MSTIGSFTGTIVKNLFSKPVTTSYPAKPKEYPERSRGHIEINMEECILCGMCMRCCPPRAIEVDRNNGDWKINRFDCVQCGYCVEKCPKKCLKIVPGYTEPMPEKAVTVEHKDVEQPAPKAAGAAPKKEKQVPEANLDQCVYCTLCDKKCPVHAITVNREEKKWELDKDSCVGCGLCATNCPKKCIEMK